MKLSAKILACGALCLLAAAYQANAKAQTASASKKRIPADPAEAELNNLLATAQAAMDKKDYPAAAQSYQEYLAKKPDNAVAHFELGYADMSMRRLADAKGEYEKAISLDPSLGPAYLNLGLTLVDSDPAAAVPNLQKALELIPNQPGPKFLLGMAFEHTGKLAAAVEQYQAAEALDGADFNIRYSLARALSASGRASEAEPEFRAALTLQPDSAPARLGLARSLIAQKRLDAAAAQLASYLQVQPNDFGVRVERASVLVDLGKDEDALAELDKAAAGAPEDLRALKLRSQIYFEKKLYDDALPVLQKAAALAPQDPDIPGRLGLVFLGKKDYPNAVRSFVAAFKMNPGANDLLGNLITAQYLDKNYPAVIDGLDLLSKREALPPGSWFMRADCYDKLEQPANALESYKKFLDLNKDQNSDMYFAAAARARTLTRELQDKKR
jgi:tetratricopeptide (TPR) repeat protein